MSEIKVPLRQTTVTPLDYAKAMIAAWPLIEATAPTAAAVAVLWAQYMVETGGRACWNFNIGNVKAPPGSGVPFHELPGTWECMSPAKAAATIAASNGLAHQSAKPWHIASTPKGLVPVVFDPPHQATRFRAFDSLAQAMQEHLVFIARRYGAAWAKAVEGSPEAFAQALKAGRDGKEGTADDYFTASADRYALNMRPAFDAFLKSGAFDTAWAPVPSDAPTVENLDELAGPLSSAPILEDDGGLARRDMLSEALCGRGPSTPDDQA